MWEGETARPYGKTTAKKSTYPGVGNYLFQNFIKQINGLPNLFSVSESF